MIDVLFRDTAEPLNIGDKGSRRTLEVNSAGSCWLQAWVSRPHQLGSVKVTPGSRTPAQAVWGLSRCPGFG